MMLESQTLTPPIRDGPMGDRLGPWSPPPPPPKSGIKKKSAVKKKIVYWPPHKNKQTLVPPLHKTKTNLGPSPRKNGPNAPQKKKPKSQRPVSSPLKKTGPKASQK
jgi:hypothetical protein